jgi:hypothetical protein
MNNQLAFTADLSPAQDYADTYPMAKIALESYLEWRNDYFTITHFAIDKGISQEFACELIREGRRIHKMND